MKTNEILQTDVQNAIKWEPLLHAAEIGVTVHDGIVSLTGTVDSYFKKVEAENATKKVAGVKAVIENIKVHFDSIWNKSNEEIAREALEALRLKNLVPTGSITVVVEDGWITLSGTLPWHYQKVAAKDAVTHLVGIRGIHDHILIKSTFSELIEREKVEDALSRSWWVNDSDITVNVVGHEVTLSGSVISYYQKEEAEAIAWKTPGVWEVTNELMVDWL